VRVDTYWVWKRGDGYISATAYNPMKGPRTLDTFTVLLETTDWPEARQRIVDERKAAGQPEDGWLWERE